VATSDQSERDEAVKAKRLISQFFQEITDKNKSQHMDIDKPNKDEEKK